MSLDWLERWKHYAPNSIAVKDGDSGRTITYEQFYNANTQAADYLYQQHNIRAGDRVAALALNEIEYLILFFALSRLGATLVPVNYRLTKPEVQYILQDCQPKLTLVQKEFADAAGDLNKFEFESYADIIWNWKGRYTDFQSTEESCALIIYTSGTTGFPKGAMLSHEMLFWNSVNTSLRLNITQTDRAVIFLPLFHTGAWNVLTTPFFHRGAMITLIKKFDAEQILKLTEQDKCSLIFGVPTTMDMMARSDLFAKADLQSVRYAIVGGEPMPVQLIENWHQKGVAIRQGYGLTEFGPNVFSLNEEDSIRKIGSIGFPNFYIDAKVVDDQGNECAADQVGELILKGPMCMIGYWNNPKATEQTIRNGWLLTGDLVRKDAEGYFYVVGRKKEMYKSGGENVYPAELEKVIRKFKGIREVAVIGVADDKWGEVGKAFYSTEGNSALDEEQLKQFLSENLAKFKIPKHFVHMPDLPKGDSGKILKKNLS